MEDTKRLLTTFLTLVAILIMVGMVFIYSASSVYALESCGNAAYFIKKQLFGLVLGLIGLFCMILLPLPAIKKFAPLFFLVSLALTYATLLPGIGIMLNGSRRWLSFGGIMLQPSELLKMCTIMYLARYIEKKQFNLRSLLHGFIPFLSIVGIVILVLLKQPDFGQAVTIGTTALALFFVAQGNLKQLSITALIGLFGATILVYFKAYRMRRILIFLNPWSDPQGAGFQIIQSLVAIGSGGTFGLGLTHSKQKFFYLPMQHTDFIFSVIAEETGFVGVTLLILAYILLLITGVKLARQFTDDFATLVTLGFVFLISLQAIINIFVASGLAPTKGIGLPFVSFGSSSLICSLFMVGLIINCALENNALQRQIQKQI
ncbi:MAG: Stage V sporulation protein E [candidate division TM6 bacterium GW2011_GWE2_42_60]|nr:MAG: Stage V sporulation protein E [candidate division TM6 bacterium GW2011_GWE2_42_60]HBY06198.1 putative lipid II flippase FtsW [Candidatus Dependentiae bacterium]